MFHQVPAIVDLTVPCPCEMTLRAGGVQRDQGARWFTVLEVLTRTLAFLCQLRKLLVGFEQGNLSKLRF